MAKRLLIVDDEPNLLRAVSLLLTHSPLNKSGGEQWVKVLVLSECLHFYSPFAFQPLPKRLRHVDWNCR